MFVCANCVCMARLKDPREREQLGERTVEINISREKEFKIFFNHLKTYCKGLKHS